MDAKHTLGPLVARRINHEAKPFAVINPAGPIGDDIVAGYLNEGDAILYAAAPEMLALLLKSNTGVDYAEWCAERDRLIARLV